MRVSLHPLTPAQALGAALRIKKGEMGKAEKRGKSL